MGDARAAWKAFFCFLKAMFGAGVLALPRAFSRVGILPGAALFLLMTVTVVASMHTLLKARHIARAQLRLRVVTYDDLAFEAFGAAGRATLQVAVVGLELLFCTGFLIVVAENLHAVDSRLQPWLVLSASFPPLLLLSCARWLRDLWLPSALGVCVYVVGVLGLVVAYGVSNPDHLTGLPLGFSHWAAAPAFVGSAFYSMESINLVLPVRRIVRTEAQARWVILGGTAVSGLVFTVFAALGAAFGFGACDIVTACLPATLLSHVVRVSLSLSLFLTHAVTLFPALEVVEEHWPALKAPPGLRVPLTPGVTPLPEAHAWCPPARALLLRAVAVGATCAGAAVIPDFTSFTRLVGALGLSLTGLVAPPLLHWRFRAMAARGARLVAVTAGDDGAHAHRPPGGKGKAVAWADAPEDAYDAIASGPEGHEGADAEPAASACLRWLEAAGDAALLAFGLGLMGTGVVGT